MGVRFNRFHAQHLASATGGLGGLTYGNLTVLEGVDFNTHDAVENELTAISGVAGEAGVYTPSGGLTVLNQNEATRAFMWNNVGETEQVTATGYFKRASEPLTLGNHTPSTVAMCFAPILTNNTKYVWGHGAAFNFYVNANGGAVYTFEQHDSENNTTRVLPAAAFQSRVWGAVLCCHASLSDNVIVYFKSRGGSLDSRTATDASKGGGAYAFQRNVLNIGANADSGQFEGGISECTYLAGVPANSTEAEAILDEMLARQIANASLPGAGG